MLPVQALPLHKPVGFVLGIQLHIATGMAIGPCKGYLSWLAYLPLILILLTLHEQGLCIHQVSTKNDCAGLQRLQDLVCQKPTPAKCRLCSGQTLAAPTATCQSLTNSMRRAIICTLLARHRDISKVFVLCPSSDCHTGSLEVRLVVTSHVPPVLIVVGQVQVGDVHKYGYTV